MKIIFNRSILIVSLILLLHSCSQSEKPLIPGAGAIQSELSEYVKISDSNYYIQENKYYQHCITVNFELIKEYDRYEGIKFIFHSMRLQLFDINNNPLMGIDFPVSLSLENLDDLLVASVGSQVNVPFCNSFDKETLSQALNDAQSFKISGIKIEKVTDLDDLPHELFGIWYGSVDKNEFNLRFQHTSRNRLIIREGDNTIFDNLKFSIWRDIILVESEELDEEFKYSLERGGNVLVLESQTHDYTFRLAKNKLLLKEIVTVEN